MLTHPKLLTLFLTENLMSLRILIFRPVQKDISILCMAIYSLILLIPKQIPIVFRLIFIRMTS